MNLRTSGEGCGAVEEPSDRPRLRPLGVGAVVCSTDPTTQLAPQFPVQGAGPALHRDPIASSRRHGSRGRHVVAAPRHCRKKHRKPEDKRCRTFDLLTTDAIED